MERKVIKVRLVSLIMIVVSIAAIIIASIFVINKLKKNENVEVEEANKIASFFSAMGTGQKIKVVIKLCQWRRRLLTQIGVCGADFLLENVLLNKPTILFKLVNAYIKMFLF